ncbi:MAG: DNA polymerase III subunit delta' [Candidatus Westeberhardia cardiocondylae]|nr:DNA polymerase III subunit delta' [Candidatus Westeberhardia cardiocondylae]
MKKKTLNKNLYPWLIDSYEKILNNYKNKNKECFPLFLHSLYNVGEDILCYTISCWLICSEPNNIKNCGMCYYCKLMQVNSYPDYYEIKLSNKKNDSINLENLYCFIDNVYRFPFYGKTKVISIYYIEFFSKRIIHLISKVLENPPKNTYFLFVCLKEPLEELTRIKSYCFYWKIPYPEEKIGLNWLSKKITNNHYSVFELKSALRIYNGSPIKAKNLLQPVLWKKRNMLFSKIKYAIFKKNFLFLLPDFLKNNAQELILWILTLLSDSIKQHFAIQNFLINIDQIKLTQFIVQSYSVNEIYVQWNNWIKCKKIYYKLDSINQELLFTNILLNWK